MKAAFPSAMFLRASLVTAMLATSGAVHAETGTGSVPVPNEAITSPEQGQVRALFGATSPRSPLWITDGTRAGTHTVQRFGSFTNNVERTLALGDGRAIFWHGQSDRGHYALWVTDGTRAGTQRVQQFPGMTGSTVTTRLQEAATSLGDGRALFIANDPRSGSEGWIPDGPFEPWITDGTRQGTRLLRNINPDGSSSPYGFTPFIPAERG